ncbi:TolC family protein [Hahella chejuensis]|uniref:TolC family protein n=1 Tax=Hahella chejuensis TaxID=158327 RepID=UPI0013051396|nr:TolC family protein [Hahella chejuensis]
MSVVLHFKRCIIPVLLLSLTACSLAPAKQAGELENMEAPAAWEHALGEGVALESLTDLIADGQLQSLLQEAMQANPDLRQTALRLRESGLTLKAQNASQLPEVSASAKGERSGSEEAGSHNAYTAGLNLSWELDIWGRLSDQSDAAGEDYIAVEEDLNAAKASLAAQVMQTWIALSADQSRLDIQQARIDSLQLTETTILERFQSGLGDLADLDAARLSTANAKAQLEQLQQTFHDRLRTLNVLLGRLPQAEILTAEILPDVALPHANTPLQVIGARPDLKAAYRRIRAEDARTNAAYKNLLPGFSLSASLSDSGERVSDLFRQSPAWSLLGSMTAPLFNGGKIKANADTQASVAERAWWSYRETLLNALNEVESGLESERRLSAQQVHYQSAREHAESSLNHYQELYSQGLADITDLLQAQRSLFDAQTQLLETRRDHMSNRITLGLALGLTL